MKSSNAPRAGAALLFLFLLSLPASAQVSDVYIVPAAANGPGAAGTVWQTSFHLMNPQSYPLEVTLGFMPTGGAAADSDAFSIEVPANMTVYSPNIVEEFFTNAPTGSLLVAVFPEDNPSASDPEDVGSRGVILQTRTFNVRSDGTVGQGIDGAMTGLLDYELDGLTAIATGVQNHGAAGVSGFRTNVGAANLGDSSFTLNVTVWDADGESLGTFPFTLPPLAHVQDRLPVEVEDGTLEFWAEDQVLPASFDEFVFPYASVVDNRTGDATYLDPKLLATPCSGGLFPFSAGRISSTMPRLTVRSVRRMFAAAGAIERATLVRAETGAMRIKRPLANQ